MIHWSSIQFLSEAQLLSFYGYWQLVVSLFAFVALMAIWWHIGRKQQDFGQVWLALSVLCWSISGGFEVAYANQFTQAAAPVLESIDHLLRSGTQEADLADLQTAYTSLEESQAQKSIQLAGWRSILSLFNSLFILMALPWFKYVPKRIEPIVKSNFWYLIVGLPFLFSLLPTINKMITSTSYGLVGELDVYYAILTLLFLGYILFSSFARRRLLMLAWLSVICILITFVAQLYKLTGSNIDLTLYSAIFKTSLIMIFFALALSWVKELAENIIPDAKQLFFELSRNKKENGRFEHRVRIKGFPGNSDRVVSLSPTLFELFETFASKKVESDEGWLEIKPKSDKRPNKAYDIKDHNEIKRLLTALLDGIFGKGSWTNDQHLYPFRDTIFEMSEKRERKIRLRVPKENLALS